MAGAPVAVSVQKDIEVLQHRGSRRLEPERERILHPTLGDEATPRVSPELSWPALFALSSTSACLLLLAAPPVDFWPLAFVALVPLYHAIRNLGPGRAALVGWWTGFLVNLAGFSWAESLLQRFVGASPAASVAIMVAVCAYQALVFAVAAGTSLLVCRRPGSSWLIAAPLCMALAEIAVPFLFPWNLAITAWRAWPILQVAEIGGAPAVSALLVLVNLVLAEAARDLATSGALGRATRRAAVVVIAVIGAGGLRGLHIANLREHSDRLAVGIVHTDFGIVTRGERERAGGRHLRALGAATDELARRGAALVVWPESSFPYLFDRSLAREFPVGHPWELRPAGGSSLLFGALTHDFGRSGVHNSAVLATADGVIAGRYDKNRLLPFAEWIPWAERFPSWAASLRERMPDFPQIEPGSEPGVIEEGELRVAPLICYEDLLPMSAGRAVRRGANLLAVLANDAWLASPGAARQHLALAVLRAVETRRDLVRATNGGVSAIVDALGRVIVASPPAEDDMGRRQTTLIEGEVALLGAFSLGPFGVRLFPWGCLLALAALAVTDRRRRR
jgi:apolipoprotein N-acyltransferase